MGYMFETVIDLSLRGSAVILTSGENRLLNASSLGGAGVKRRVKRILQYEQKSRFQVGVYFLVFLCLMVVAGTEIRDMRPEIEDMAEKWVFSNYSVNYEVRNVVSKVLRKNDALEGERYVVRLECETKSRTDSGDADSSQWEETTMEVVILDNEGDKGLEGEQWNVYDMAKFVH